MNEEFEVDETVVENKAEALIDALFENGLEEASARSSYDDDSYDAEDLDYEDDDIEDDEDEGAVPYMQNRELSWLTFNERVLDQGADESVPLLERLNFISIFWSNLQEFFMVRVGSLTDLSFIDPPVIDSKTGMTPDDQIKAIHERCHELYPIQESTYEHVRGQLAKEGVRHLRPDDLSEEQRNYLFGLVRHNIEPFLSPQIINSRHPFPHLENGKLYILVRLDDEAAESERKKKKKKKAKKEKGGAEGVVLGLIPLPHQCERVIKLPGRGFQFILLEHAIEMFVPEIFSMYKIKHTNVICVTRNADIDANQTGDEQDEDYREHMKRLLKQRARLAPVRLECERPLSPVMEKLMLKKLGLKRSRVYDTIVPLDLSFTWGLGSRLSDSKRERLSNPSFTPAWPTCFDRKRRIIDQVAEHDVLVSYPYESMDPFVQLLREASNDPDVISIKITLYRLASQSHLAEALIAAADAGKEVTALFELRARFDENNNIEWSQRFEQAGCNVLYGFRDYKVHSKICCITRRTPEGTIQHITQLGTGNYNEKTARLYTDFSFITVDEAFGRDAVEFFRNMQLENVSDNYEILRVAPLQIKSMLIDNLDKQIARARQGLPASAFMKANSVTDKDIIEKISEASNAGVRIVLFIRGICCLIPRVKGATENVRVVSIVGRLLEHSRVYCFGPAEDCIVYLSSADLMTRNLNKRVEIAWPLPGGEIRDKVLSYIDFCMRDTAKLRELRPNATYTPLGAFCELDEDGNPKPSFDAQSALIKIAADQASYAALSNFESDAKADAAVETAEELGQDRELPNSFQSDVEPTVYDIVGEKAELETSLEDTIVNEAKESAPLEAPAIDEAFTAGPNKEERVESSVSEDLATNVAEEGEPAESSISDESATDVAAEGAPIASSPIDDIFSSKPCDEEPIEPLAVDEPQDDGANEEESVVETASPIADDAEADASAASFTDTVQSEEESIAPIPSLFEAEVQPVPEPLPEVQVDQEAVKDEPVEVVSSLVDAPIIEADAHEPSQEAFNEPTLALMPEPSQEVPDEEQTSELAPEPSPQEPVSEEPPSAPVAETSPGSETPKEANSDDGMPALEGDAATKTSDRVSELIAQLSATPGQEVPLQEMTLQNLQNLPTHRLDEELTEMNVAEIESLAFEGADSLKVYSVDASPQEAESVQPPASPAVEAEPAPTSVSEPAAPVETAEPETPKPVEKQEEGAPSTETATVSSDEPTSFLETPHREINMPPEKKQGFFSRLWK